MVTKLIFLTLSLFFLQLLTKSVIVLVNRNLLFTNEETVIEQKGVLIMKKNWQEPCIAELTMKATETETYHLHLAQVQILINQEVAVSFLGGLGGLGKKFSFKDILTKKGMIMVYHFHNHTFLYISL